MKTEQGARRLWVLALGTFAIGTDGFVIAGVLPGIARDTASTLAAAGLLVTAFALVYAVAAPLLTAAAARAERRAVLVAGMTLLAVANAAGAVAHGYGWIMAARVGAALGAALYSPIALATGVQLSKPSVRGRAISLVLGGMTVSLVTGVPLGALVGTLGSWRWTFAFVAVIAAACAAAVAILLPRVAPTPASSLRARLALLRQAAIAAGAALGGVVVGHLAVAWLGPAGPHLGYQDASPDPADKASAAQPAQWPARTRGPRPPARGACDRRLPGRTQEGTSRC